MSKQRTISIIVPAYNEQDNIKPLIEAVSRELKKFSWDILFVDDGSSDGTLKVLKAQSAKNKRVSYVSFSRNFGHQAALRAGLKFAQGDAVVSMDADMQHPPELLTKLIAEWEHGSQVVYTIREDSDEQSFLKKITSKLFYKTINFLSDLNIQNGAADFRLLDRKIVTIINEEREADLFFVGTLTG